MNARLPERFRSEQACVEALIRQAFRRVTRDRGTSWSESVIVDGDGSGRTREQARAEDTERSWEELVDNPSWHLDEGMGGFNFLDPIGFRYYIAPAMIRCVREGGGDVISFALTVDGDVMRGQVSLINPKQAHVIARLIRLMIAIHTAAENEISSKNWSRAYTLHWRRFDRGGSDL